MLTEKLFLTFDIDWVHDDAINRVIDLCITHKVKATFFITHASRTTARIKNLPEQFEIGIHPNFLSGSTHGTNEEDVLSHCQDLMPNILSIRTHCLYQHSKLYNLYNMHYGDSLIDSSVFMPGCTNIEPYRLYTEHGQIVKVPVIWADDYHCLGKDKQNPINYVNVSGCKVYCFHPVHIFHNTISMEHYNAIKHNQNTQSFSEQRGIYNIFLSFLDSITKHQKETGLIKEFLKYDFK
ncbi:MAG: hypothetical protein Q8K36_03630 [Alphaproteobacteria bacterium]|nr:hypothetical protein [Alphaproteobacteria bacterium]